MIISIDDGCASDVRVAELAKKYGIDVIFYWPVEWHSLAYDSGYEPLSYANALTIALDHEIGSHTITHRHLTKIPEVEAKYEISESQIMLQNMFSRPITNFAPPRGYSNDLLTEFTKKFYQKQRLTKGKGLVHIHPNSGANGNKNWIDCIDENTEEIWGHSYDFDRFNMWDELEKVLSDRS